MVDKIAWPSEIVGWKPDSEGVSYDRETLFDYIDGAAEVYLAYNFRQASVRRYVKTDKPPIIAEVYRMATSEDAFGVFSFERQDPEAGIGQGSEFGGSLLRFWKGNHFVSVLGEGEGKEIETAVMSLGRELAALIKERGEPPRLLRYLPDLPSSTADRLCFVRSHILLNRCFFISHQNILGLAADVEAVLARYPQGKGKLRLLLVRYPSEVRARDAFAGFRDAYMPEAVRNDAIKTEDGTWTGSQQHHQFVIVVFGSPSQSDAESVVQATLTKLKEEGL